MRRADLDALLREAPRARRTRLGRIAAELERAVREPWFDRSSWEAVVAVCQRCGLSPPVWEPSPLAVGETWLLLYEGTAGVGTVAKLRVKREGCPASPIWGPEAQAEARGALAGLVATLSERHKRLPELPFQYPLTVESPSESAVVTGGSLGVAACVAVASAALKVPSANDVAATACVNACGALQPVTFLSEKLEALALHQPGVTTLIVAKGQALPEGQWPVRLLPCATLVEALEQFGLPWKRLPPTDVNSHRRALRGFALDDEDTTAGAEWERLAETALTAYRVLSNAGTAYRAEAGEALGWWVLFSAHAGRGADIDAFRDDYKALSDAVEPHVRALIEVFAASSQIDPDPASAVEASRAALAAARDLDRGRDTVLGRALGTHGRALLHAGEPGSALTFLQQAVDEHRKVDPREVPRSLTYLATATRMAGDGAAALTLCDEALDELQQSTRLSWAGKTRAYLQLERGRCLLEIQRLSEAANAFEEVVRSCEYDHEHPRSGAIRGLATAHRSLGNHGAAAEYYGRCLSVARHTGHWETLRRVAAMAIADAAVAANKPPSVEEATVWRTLFAEPLTRDGAQTALRCWVY